MISKRKKWTIGLVGGALFLLAGLGYWAYRKGFIFGGKYVAENVYKAPEGLKEIPKNDVPYTAIKAVRVVYNDFELTRAAIGADGLYLFEDHEGFDPLVFRVTEAA